MSISVTNHDGEPVVENALHVYGHSVDGHSIELEEAMFAEHRDSSGPVVVLEDAQVIDSDGRILIKTDVFWCAKEDGFRSSSCGHPECMGSVTKDDGLDQWLEKASS